MILLLLSVVVEKDIKNLNLPRPRSIFIEGVLILEDSLHYPKVRMPLVVYYKNDNYYIDIRNNGPYTLIVNNADTAYLYLLSMGYSFKVFNLQVLPKFGSRPVDLLRTFYIFNHFPLKGELDTLLTKGDTVFLKKRSMIYKYSKDKEKIVSITMGNAFVHFLDFKKIKKYEFPTTILSSAKTLSPEYPYTRIKIAKIILNPDIPDSIFKIYLPPMKRSYDLTSQFQKEENK